MKIERLLGLLAISLTLAACGSGGDEAPLDRSKHLDDLTTAETGQFCDAINTPQGGYGRRVSCPYGSTQNTDVSRADCVAAVPQAARLCPALTVGDGVRCSETFGTDLCRMSTDLQCTILRDCINEFSP